MGEKDWKPISTCPQDDSEYLVYCHGSGKIYQVFRYQGDDRFRIYASGGRILYEPPSHWRSIPDPPEVKP